MKRKLTPNVDSILQHIEKGGIDDALRFLDNSLACDPNDADLFWVKGQLHQRMAADTRNSIADRREFYTKALGYFNQAAMRNPELFLEVNETGWPEMKWALPAYIHILRDIRWGKFTYHELTCLRLQRTAIKRLGAMGKEAKEAIPCLEQLEEIEGDGTLGRSCGVIGLGADIRKALSRIRDSEESGAQAACAASVEEEVTDRLQTFEWHKGESKYTPHCLDFDDWISHLDAEKLLLRLQSVDEVDRVQASCIIGATVVADREIVRTLFPLSDDKKAPVRAMALYALWRLASVKNRALEIPTDWLRQKMERMLSTDRSSHVRKWVAEGLGRLAPTPEGLAHLIQVYLEDDSPYNQFRTRIIEAFGEYGPAARSALHLVTGFSPNGHKGDEEFLVRALALLRISENAHEYITELLPTIKCHIFNGYRQLRVMAINTLCQIGSKHPLVIPILVNRMWLDDYAAVRFVASESLKRIDPEAAMKAGAYDR